MNEDDNPRLGLSAGYFVTKEGDNDSPRTSAVVEEMCQITSSRRRRRRCCATDLCDRRPSLPSRLVRSRGSTPAHGLRIRAPLFLTSFVLVAAAGNIVHLNPANGRAIVSPLRLRRDHRRTYVRDIPRGGGGGSWISSHKSTTFLDKLFDSADLDHDGQLSVNELYEMVLKLYIKINRQAPVPPPTKETVARIFAREDKDHSDGLDREQFRHFMLIISERAATRVSAVMVSQLAVAPLLAIHVVGVVGTDEWWTTRLVEMVPKRFRQGAMLDAKFWTTVLTVVFFATIGEVVLALTDVVLNLIGGVNQKDEEEDWL